MDLERSAREGRPRITGSSRPTTATGSARWRSSPPPAFASTAGGPPTSGLGALASEDGDTRTGFGSRSAGRRRATSTSTRPPTTPHDRRPACSEPAKPASSGSRWSSTRGSRPVPRHRGGRRCRRGGAEGPVALRRAGGRGRGGPAHLVDDPTDRRRVGVRPTTARAWPTRRTLIGDGVLHGFLHNTYTGRRSGTASTGSAVRGFKPPPASGCQALTSLPGDLPQPDLLGRIGSGLLVPTVWPGCTRA